MKRLKNALLFRQVDANRIEGCQLYEDCLRFAGVQEYTSWSCAGCLDCRPVPIKVSVPKDSAWTWPVGREPISDLQEFIQSVTRGMYKAGVNPKMDGDWYQTQIEEGE